MNDAPTADAHDEQPQAEQPLHDARRYEGDGSHMLDADEVAELVKREGS